MKRTKKIITLAMAAVLLVSTTVAVTVAYLQDATEVVKNTFSVGDVQITLDEADVNLYGVANGTVRDKANEYKLIPGHTYVKDPTVHVDSTSEDCYLFVEVVNNLGAAEAESVNGGYQDIEAQMTANGWVKMATPNTNIWYLATNGIIRKIDVDGADKSNLNFEVFKEFKVLETAIGGATPATGAVEGAVYLDDYKTENDANKYITIKAYAIQADGFENSDVTDIWAAVTK